MPIHDWTKMLDGDFHHFHLSWANELAIALNKSLGPRCSP